MYRIEMKPQRPGAESRRLLVAEWIPAIRIAHEEMLAGNMVRIEQFVNKDWTEILGWSWRAASPWVG